MLKFYPGVEFDGFSSNRVAYTPPSGCAFCPTGPYRNIFPTHSFASSLLVNTPHRAMRSPSTEDYLKTLHKLEEQEGAPVSTGALAQAMDVSSASASNMVKRLDDLDFLTYEAYGGRRSRSRAAPWRWRFSGTTGCWSST